VPVEVPAIVTRKTWEAAQNRLAQNRGRLQGQAKTDQYLVRQRVTCGHCGLAVAVNTATNPKKRKYGYYRCPAGRVYGKYRRECTLPLFPAFDVDHAVWQWLKNKLTDVEQLERGLLEIHEEREELNAPIRNRLAVTEDLLAKNRVQLERLVDLYLSGEFPKEILTERKARLEKLIADLESQKARFMEHLASQSLTIEQIKTAKDLAEQINARIDAIDEDVYLKRQLVEILDLRATLAIEEGEKVVYVSCHLGDDQVFVYCSTAEKLEAGKQMEHDGRQYSSGQFAFSR
jgi:hypothetical protein